MSNKSIEIHDTTFRDGAQSLWAMRVYYGMLDATLSEMDQAGFSCIEVPVTKSYITVANRFLKENAWETFRLCERKIKNTTIMTPTLGMMFDPFAPPECVPMVQLWIQTIAKLLKRWGRTLLICNTRDEIEREFPILFPLFRAEGVEPIPYITYSVSPRHTDEFYARVTRDVMKFKPIGVCLKDVGGLLTPERARTLIPVIMREAKGVPLEIHSHGMSGFQTAVFAEAMKLGVRRFQTCIPPLAYGSSHPSIYNTLENAQYLGLTNNINLEPVKIVEERLTAIAKQENLPIGTPLPFDLKKYSHQVPGGVISNTVAQLQQLGIAHKLDEVLEEVPRILKDLGYPIMITPHSQFIVTQAAINVAVGERYKEIIDAMIEFALGVYGYEDAGVPYMDPNVKDKFLSHPNAKAIAEKWEIQQAKSADASLKEIRAKIGMTGASDEDFLTCYFMKGEDELKKMKALGLPRSFYTGKEPLVMLLKELSKMKDISRLHLQKGNSVFDFRQA